MNEQDITTVISVHCRIGSLETIALIEKLKVKVHCRIGSLENKKAPAARFLVVHCRIGSLEIP